eukprot:TRINITY_DN23154_c0_g1_i1.p1 TRINITY_DN23154_c0_g1~~TRINITY_DN23154_c0_g1_i1.p1  ORF type:complete len:646 (+),score=123.99 TRINITY_DN23154_c0_g1_i1:785-2722(+)
MLSVLRVHLPSDIPIAGCELAPYVLLRKPDATVTPDDIPETNPFDGYYLRCRWYRIQSEKRNPAVAVCCVHISEPATLQCLGCLKAKVPAARSYHCSPQCFAAAWRHHRAMHARSMATAASRENGVAAMPGTTEEEDLIMFGRFGSTGGSTGNSLGGGGSYSGPSNGANGMSTAGMVYGSGGGGGLPRPVEQANGETWYEVGRGKTYTPSADDVGHVLKLECTPVEAASGLPVAAPSVLLTSRVIPAPSPTPRRLISVVQEGLSASLDPSGKFSVLSYNVLADLYATSEMYSYCPPWALSWAYRRQNLLRELLGYRADILCLQEVQSDHYEEFFNPEFAAHGYLSVYKKKTGEVYTGSAYAIDGCATFYRKDRFSLVKKYEVEFNKAALSLADAMGPANGSNKKAALNRLLKDNVALIVVLEAPPPRRDGGGDSGALDLKRQLLCVANTHIHANPELKDVKLWQVNTLLKGLEKIAASADIPMLVAGDFNSVPGSAPHSLLTTGRVEPMHPELATDPLGILRPSTKLCHTLPLVSAYTALGARDAPRGTPDLERQRRRMDIGGSNEPLFTNCTRDFIGTLDYIFYTGDSLEVESLLELLDEDALRNNTALPSPEWSSDHIALLAEFRCKPRVHGGNGAGLNRVVN